MKKISIILLVAFVMSLFTFNAAFAESGKQIVIISENKVITDIDVLEKRAENNKVYNENKLKDLNIKFEATQDGKDVKKLVDIQEVKVVKDKKTGKIKKDYLITGISYGTTSSPSDISDKVDGSYSVRAVVRAWCVEWTGDDGYSTYVMISKFDGMWDVLDHFSEVVGTPYGNTYKRPSTGAKTNLYSEEYHYTFNCPFYDETILFNTYEGCEASTNMQWKRTNGSTVYDHRARLKWGDYSS